MTFKYILLRLKRFCGFITGFVFFLSGIFKLLDPVGAGLVMKEYFAFLHISFLDFAAKPLAGGTAFLETVIGTALITGIWRRMTAFAGLAMQGFFTLLSILLVIFNPSMDCGCFGEAVHLTHMQTFLKNIVLCLLLICYTFPVKALGGPKRKKFVSFGIVTISVMVFTAYSWMFIPMVDFTDYKPATALQASDIFPTSEEDLYEAVFTYEKDGRKEQFTLDCLPDSTWTYLSTETRLRKEYSGSIIGLSFYDSNGDYYDRLAADGKVMVISVFDPDIRNQRWVGISAFITRASKAGFRPLVLVAGSENELQARLDRLDEPIRKQLERHIYFADYKTLITMNRSNGGVTYFSDGYLIRKWSSKTRPNVRELAELYNGDDTESMIENSTEGSLGFQGFLLYVFAVMLLL